MGSTPAQLYRRMLRIRRIEEAVADAYPRQQMKCPVHLSIGQEAVAAGVCDPLTAADHLYSNHRCHAHYLAKGGDLKGMIAELHGKRTGCARGKGGSMHLVDFSVGMMGASALVAGTIPIACGSALAFQRGGKPNVAVTFFGDGATEEGILYESLNFAALKKLPVIFVCENNGYATYSGLSARQAVDSSAEKARAFGLPATQLDGNDVLVVRDAAEAAIRRAREGGGPTYLECVTYRHRDHVGPALDHQVGYRTKEEVDSWIARCPLTRLAGQVPEALRSAWEKEIAAEIEEAFAFAIASPLPDRSDLLEEVYAQP
jgi:TPP-dependent pyruvate/acetoin dehydrogenase alpha subunit